MLHIKVRALTLLVCCCWDSCFVTHLFIIRVRDGPKSQNQVCVCVCVCVCGWVGVWVGVGVCVCVCVCVV